MWVVPALALALLACCRIGFDHGDVHGGVDADLGDANAGDGSLPLRCVGLAATCGPTGTNDCCASLPVPGGTFYRSFDVATDGMHVSMANQATVGSFSLDQYEVTVGRYRLYVMAGGGLQSSAPVQGAGARTLNGMANQGGWDAAWTANLPANAAAQQTALLCSASATWTASPGANESLPINCVNWYDAMAFCISDGGFLPTEAQWNYAAAGGTEQRAYPWSSPASSLTIDCSYANYNGPVGYCTDPPNGAARRVGNGSPIGDGRWGHADLAGNQWEWTLDWNGTYPNPCNDCALFTPAANRIGRGGYFRNTEMNMRTAGRSSFPPDAGMAYNGIRCARM